MDESKNHPTRENPGRSGETSEDLDPQVNTSSSTSTMSDYDHEDESLEMTSAPATNQPDNHFVPTAHNGLAMLDNAPKNLDSTSTHSAQTKQLDHTDHTEGAHRVGEASRRSRVWSSLFSSQSLNMNATDNYKAIFEPIVHTSWDFNDHPPPSTSPSRNTAPGLSERDAHAIQYGKSLLQEGDTLVFILFPNDSKAYDEYGFEIATKHLVHSKNLLATGSSWFKAKLTDWESHKVQRRHKLIGNPPPGVKYFLDLTPKDEGDEALDLTAALSCPEGFLQWHTAKDRLGVSATLVGGKDETANCPSPLGHSKTDNDQNADSDRPEVHDYDPIRHRTGIERILQIIEGKTVRLDSAPKVWTLAALAEYFDCRATVMDYIFTWVWADPNCRIIEILPESILRLGTILQSPRLVQTAFSVLVSEEALDIGTKVYHPSPKTSRTFGRNETKFGRTIESLDEDNSSMVEYAGAAFATRVNQVIQDLCDPEMEWLWASKSIDSLKAFAEHLRAHGADTSVVTELKDKLNHYVRGRLLWCYVAQLDVHQASRAQDHRTKESWKQGVAVKTYEQVYDSLGGREKVMTRFFWERMRDLDWDTRQSTNLIREYLNPNHPMSDAMTEVADSHRVERVTMRSLMDLNTTINKQIRHEFKTRKYNNGHALRQNPDGESNPTPLLDKVVRDILDSEYDDILFAPGHWTERLSVLNTPTTTSDAINPMNPFDTSGGFFPRVPDYLDILPEDSVYFSLQNVFRDINRHVNMVCNRMLSYGDNDWSTLCDTLLCVGEEEYKFLPLYAGGLNDGTGGVFADLIPAAEKGPIGPGPAFNTGDTIGSQASSCTEWDSMSDAYTETMDGVNTSLGVQDGYSDYLPRGAVVSEDEFPLDHSENAIKLTFRAGPTAGKGEEKAVEHIPEIEPMKEKEVENADKDYIMSDDFLETPIYEYESDEDDEDDDGNMTE